MKHEYTYSGPVMQFGTCIDRNWKAATWADSEKKAMSNLSFRYKRDHNMARNTKIELTGKLIVSA